jgi:hypothetical protein
LNQDLERRIIDALLGKRLVTNHFRGTLVEAMLAHVLEPEWRWCSADWASHDFEHASGTRLEVKQSAALQSWHEEGLAPNKGTFDIAPRKVRWEGPRRIEEAGRYASIYVFAWHPLTDPVIADHRQPEQWQFHVVRTCDLPDQKTIALSRVRSLAEPLGLDLVSQKISDFIP